SGKKKFRIVIDYRSLNEITIDDKYPIPVMDEILDKLGKCQYFTTIDLAKGFHQIQMDENSISKTAFSTKNGHYEYTRMPFGLKNAPATFQRCLNNLLEDLIYQHCLVYMDDIIIFSTSLEEHILSIKKVFSKLREANLKLQLDKCEFMKKETEFLGHIITTEGIKPNPQKIEAIQKFPIPKTQKEIKSFLGLCGFYRKFIPDFAKIAKPMTVNLKKGSTINSTNKEYLEAFEKLKLLITSDPILIYPNFEKLFSLTTDASNVAIGAVLSQNHKPICYASRTLNEHEINYSAIEKETSPTDSCVGDKDYSILRVVENSIPQSMTISEIANHSTKDEIIDAMCCLDCDSWKPGSLKELYPFRYELSAIGALLLRGNRIVIPTSLRNRVLELAHEGHPGESAEKRRLRSKVWWPLIDRDAEKYVNHCTDCPLVSQNPKPAPMERNPFPTGPWIWVASDILGPLPNNEFVVVFIDYYSRYMEFKFLRSITSASLIEVMREIFCRLEYPKHLRTDNGRQFISQEFEEYCKTCGNTQPRITSTQENHGDDERKGQQRRQSTDKLDPLPTKSLKLKLVNKGGMWEPVTGGDVTNESGDAARERVKGSTDKSDLAVEE
ncbi:uncharacterized protein LOC123257372, partial [Drosophila ananassae]|uniref:uncharacterized protein LOC123257372 n=1 Tax=Drosophila ananassae TaxID=7217 RepID=UPI001D0014B7